MSSGQDREGTPPGVRTSEVLTERTTASVQRSVREVAAFKETSGGPRHYLASPRRLIRASAGTGKTFQLSSRYISILRTTTPERILASTFTRKAAGEILERVLQRLARAATNPDKLRELAGSVDGPPLQHRECLSLLSSLTRQLHRVRISTLDGFFARLATTFSLELGLPVGWSMLSEVEAGALQSSAITALLSDGSVQELRQLMELLDKGQSGNSVHSLIASKVDEFYGLFRQSPATAWDRFPEVHFLSELERKQLVDAYESLPLEGRLKSARTTDCARIAAEDWEGILSKGLMPKVIHGELTYYSKPIPAEVVAVYERLRDHLQAVVIRPWAQQTKATYELLKNFDKCFQAQKNELGGLQFDDVTHALAARLGQQNAREIAYRMDGGIDHLLLDEFQDTAPLQWSVLKPFAEETCRSANSSFFCVGDVKQAIYGWRGGEAAIFNAIQDALPDVEATTLDQSRRSSQVIMETVNRAFRGMANHNGLGDQAPLVQQWSHDFPEHQTALDLPGYAVLRTIPVPAGVSSATSEEMDSIRDAYVARYVQQLFAESEHHTIGVLVRNNATIGRIMFELNKLGVPASEEGGNPLTDSAAVQLVLSLLQLADHPGDTIARFHLAQSVWAPALGLTDFRDALQAEQLAERVRRELLQFGYGNVVHRWTSELAASCNERELRRLRQLEALADAYDLRFTLRTRDFAEFIRNEKVLEPQDARVRVMNVHQSKGLEFDCVVLPELDKQLARVPPYFALSSERLAPPEFIALQRKHEHFLFLPAELRPAYTATWARQYEGSLCVLYVAMTRAVHALHMLVEPRLTASQESSLPKTYAGLLRAGLAPEIKPDSDTVLFSSGNPNWAQSTEVDTKTAADSVEKNAVALTPIRIQLAPLNPTRQRHLTAVTPSQEEGDRFVRLSHVIPRGNAAALDRGSLFHAWFEQIKWLDEAKPSDDTLRRIARTIGAESLNVERCLTQFHAMLRVPAIAGALSRRSYQSPYELPFPPHIQADLAMGPVELKVITERRFSVQVSDQLITGSIDRLVLISRNWQILAADILDFKTDALPDDPKVLAERVGFYRGQLASYQRAVAQIHHLEPDRISARLVLLGAGRVESV